ncbi:multi-sensor hybrid histidine kinase [Chloroherpeton thalassium ATCC 35110]|uniref:histidine kinase n=1 Tax=Chloroherpeton thalassium (strain ATCC 35110 / GB-78) TaxID=517418 RepID=B3QVV0_CHLT3|nr:PAS domain S-box protein [Chloroherpeton thalassium]ACF13157.1 multi-sensor hybrid histidine kinase [Chloroherpeton thalassium ATCC 35110]
MSSTESSRVYERLERLNAILKAIRHVGHLVNREKDAHKLLQQAVDILIETRKYEAVWIALLQEAKINAIFHASKGKNYGTFFEKLQGKSPLFCTLEALRHENAISICHHNTACKTCPLFSDFPSGAAIAAKIFHNDVLYGALTVYVSSATLADQEELDLITGIAGDIGFALYSIEMELKATQATKAMKEREEKYRSLFHFSTDAIVIYDVHGALLEANQKAIEMFGYENEAEIKTRRLIDHHPSIENEFLESTCAALKKEGLVHLEISALRKDGAMFPAEISATLIKIDEKKYIQWIVRDLVAKKQADAALLENAAHYQALFENSPIPLWEEDCSELVEYFRHLTALGISDIPTYLEENPEAVYQSISLVKIVDMNRAALALHRAASKEILTPVFPSILVNTSIEAIKEILISIAQKKPKSNIDVKITTLDGEDKEILLSWDTVPGYEQTLKRVFVSTIDITPLKQAQTALQTQERFLDDVFNSIQDGISVLDANLNVIRVNRSMENRHANQMPLVGKKCYEAYRDRSTPCPHCPTMKALQTGKPHTDTVQVPHNKIGETGPSWIELRAFPIKSDDGNITGVIEYIKDITLQKQIEEQHLISEERLNLAVLGAGVGLWDWHVTSDELITNERWAEIIGYTLEELQPITSQTRRSLVHPEDLSHSAILLKEHFKKRTSQYECEVRMKHKTGEWVWVLERGKVMEWDENRLPIRMAGTLLDISLRKLTEETLRKNEHFLQTITDCTPSFIYIYDLIEGRNFWVNPTHQQIFGEIFYKDTSTLAFHDIMERMHPDDKSKMSKCIPSLQNKPDGEIFEVEFRMIDDDGVCHWFDDKVSVFERNEKGEITKIIGAGIDVSARKRAETAQQESRAQLLSVLNNSPLQIWAFNGEEYLFLSEEWYRYSGQQRTPHPGIDIWLEAVPTEDLGRAGAVWQKAWAEKSAHDNFFRLRNFNGEYRYFQCRAVPIFNHDGEFQYFIGYNVDISDRIRAEEELRKFSKVVEQSPSCVLITDLNGNIEYVNPFFTKLTGYSAEEVLGKNPKILKSGEMNETVYDTLWKTITAGGIWNGELHNQKKNGELFWEEVSICPLFDEEGYITHYFAVKQDITSKKKIEEQLRQSQKMEAIGQLAGGVAHDFNNILTVILANSEIALAKLKDQPSAQDNIQQVKKAANRAASLTRQLLAFSRKQILEPKILDLNDLIQNLQKMLARLIGEDISLIIKYAPNLKQIKADPGQIEQVIVNLAVNARDAMPSGGNLIIETENAHVDESFFKHHNCLDHSEFVLMTITDTGLGMDKATLKRIFEPFFTTKGQSKGTGLGLATVYGIIRQSGGLIQVYSEPEMGTVFKVYLPAISEKTKPEIEHEEFCEDLTGTETILLVEDEAFIREVISKGLTDLGYTIFDAANGEEALDISKKYGQKIDLLLTDVVMPKMSGKELSDKIMADRPNLKVVYMSGYTDTAIVNHGVLEEGTLFIQKPFAIPMLAKFIREVL